MAWLTKSHFLAGLQCPKRLWFEVHQPLEERVPATVAQLNGRAVDRLLQRLQPGVLITRAQGMPAAIAETRRVLAAGPPPILYQPAFRAGNLAVIADALHMRSAGVTLIEVKSATSVRAEHLPDVAFQALVLRRCGIALDRVLLLYVDSQFELRSPGEYEGLLIEQDLSSEVESLLPEVESATEESTAVMAQKQMPQIPMGPQCTRPHPCPYIARCTAQQGPAPLFPVELLPRGGKIVPALRAEGYRDLLQVPIGRLKGAVHQRVHQATLSGTVFFDAAATRALRKLGYPRAYLDFETIGLAVPEFTGTHPYEPWPFQWSLHVEQGPGQIRHAEYLAPQQLGDLAALAGALLRAMPESGPVFAYNASFEKGVLLRMAERLPALAIGLREVAGRLFDLLPVTRAAYYHRDMQGSWSIKSVLPTLAPELDYRQLHEVQEGDGAQRAVLELHGGEVGEARRAELEQALRHYCERDTWALVLLRRYLCGEPLTTDAQGARA
jgi:CRISPR/Cas system-associated exonuclease Cas4 (RecB family)